MGGKRSLSNSLGASVGCGRFTRILSIEGLVARRRLLVGILFGVVSLIFYWITLAPDILAHDVADWQAAAATAGISHAPGAPAYNFIAWLFTLVPLGSIPERVNFLSAVVGAIGVVALYTFVLMLFNRLLPAVIAAASLMVAAQWWSYASVAQPYNMVLTIIALFLVLLMLWQRKGDPRIIYGAALLLGFGLAWHLTVIYFLPALVAGVFILGPWRRLLAPIPLALIALCLATGLSFFIYLPIRSAADPPIMYTKINSWSSFQDYVNVSQSNSVGGLSLPRWDQFKEILEVVIRKGYFPSYAFLVFVPAVLLLYRKLWPRLSGQKRMLWYLLGAMISQILLAGVVASSSMQVASSVQYTQYYMPVLLYFTIWVGISINLLIEAANELLQRRSFQLQYMAVVTALYLGVLALSVHHVWSFVDHSNDRSMRELTEEVFERAGQGQRVLANWETYTSILYAQVVEGKRQDIVLTNVTQENWHQDFIDSRSGMPPALYVATLPASSPQGLQPLSDRYYLSFKGRTYQDRTHGEPYPLTTQLFQVLKVVI